MGMFDSYMISQNFKCPNCGLEFNKEQDFQSKELECCLSVYQLGDIIDPNRRRVDFYGYCDNHYNRHDYDKPKNKDGEYPIIKASCKEGHFNCEVTINEKGIAIKEKVTMHDKKRGEDILIYIKEIYPKGGIR